MSKEKCVPQPRSLEERLELAGRYEKEYLGCKGSSMPLLVDNMNNDLNRTYSLWPERFYIIEAGKVVYKGEPGPWGYSLESVRGWLAQRFSSST